MLRPVQRAVSGLLSAGIRDFPAPYVVKGSEGVFCVESRQTRMYAPHVDLEVRKWERLQR